MKPIGRRTLLQTSLALGVALHWRQAQACEYFTSNLRITHPWTRATPVDAAFAVVGMRFDEVMQADRLLAVETPVAEAVVFVTSPSDQQMLALPLDIPAGADTVLSDSGTHLRLLRLTQPLEVGRSYPMRLVFERGGTVKAVLTVDYARFL
jgi:copper(I)-binding protein